jgi:DNA polymerase-1
MISAFRDGMDLHCLTAAGIGEYTYEEIKENKENKNSPHYKLRQLAKAINFGTIYCMGPQTLVRNLWENQRMQITLEEAEKYLANFFVTYPGVAEYISRTQAFATRFGFVHTYTGRRRRFPILRYNSREGTRVGRQAVNCRIQTTSAELVHTNMVDVDTHLLKPYGGRMLMTVHDSMPFQLPKEVSGQEVRKMLDKLILEKTSERYPWLPVPWKYDVERGENYGNVEHF